MRLEIVDVFAETPLSGNQLAVVRDCGVLGAVQMQAMAAEMNFSETTFVLEEDSNRARVRIFTPTFELPFAGHPTLGTAWVLADGRERFVLELEAGNVPVDFSDGLAWFTPPPIELAETYEQPIVSDWLGVDPSLFDSSFPVQRGLAGLDFLFVALDSRETLSQFEINIAALRALPAHSLFVFSAHGGPKEVDYCARMFFDAGGLREDPATGGANSVFAAYLAKLRGPDFNATIAQGVDMGRPSRIYLEVREGHIRVGGRVQRIARGQWEIDAESD